MTSKILDLLNNFPRGDKPKKEETKILDWLKNFFRGDKPKKEETKKRKTFFLEKRPKRFRRIFSWDSKTSGYMNTQDHYLILENKSDFEEYIEDTFKKNEVDFERAPGSDGSFCYFPAEKTEEVLNYFE